MSVMTFAKTRVVYMGKGPVYPEPAPNREAEKATCFTKTQRERGIIKSILKDENINS